MKWYKHDPSAALAGMIGLTVEERGAYYTLIDLQYARAPHGDVTDELVIKALAVRPQVWRRLKSSLIAKGKVREADGKLLANRVETEVQTAGKLIEKMADLRARQLENQPVKPDGAARTTTTTTRKKEAPNGAPQLPLADPEADLFRRGKEVAGKEAGGLIAKLLKAKNRNVALARAIIETASTKQSPREYIAAVIRGNVDPADWRASLAL